MPPSLIIRVPSPGFSTSRVDFHLAQSSAAFERLERRPLHL